MSGADFGEPDADFGDPPAPDWRDDPGWSIADFDAEFFGEAGPPPRPTAEAELAQPDCWASLYAGRKLVATWSRGYARSTPSAPASTIAV